MKKKLNNQKMRSAYYGVVDKLPELLNQAKTIQDKELIKLTREMEKKLEQIRIILDDRYIWD